MMHRLSLIAALSAAVLTGCQSVPTADEIDRMQAPDAHASHAKNPVSYTHLTLPTICSV